MQSMIGGDELKADEVKVSLRASRFAQHLQEHGANEYEDEIEFPISPKRIRGTCLTLEKRCANPICIPPWMTLV